MSILEDRIVAAMQRLQAEQSDCERHMFVLPTNLMVNSRDIIDSHDERVVHEDVVALICRPLN